MAEQPRPARRGRPDGGSRPGARPPASGDRRPPAPAAPERRAAYDLLRAVADHEAYANLTLPRMLSDRDISGRDAALATELGYGTLRARGTLDAVVAACVDRELSTLDPAVLDLLRLGAYQLLRTRVPPHAAVGTTVDLARATGNGRAAGFINAVLRRISGADWDGWVDTLGRDRDPVGRLALRTAHPDWIVRAFAAALGDPGLHADPVTPGPETEAALLADDARPQTHLVAWPGLVSRAELCREADGDPGPYSPYAVRMRGGDPAGVGAIRGHRAAVQDEGSQLCALALAQAPLTGPDSAWLDLCAGPGGKAALLAAVAAGVDATLTANELHPHRAELVTRATRVWPVRVVVGDATLIVDPAAIGGPAMGFDRVLVDAPCSGLGALRRRPEARWRRTEADLAALVALQTELLVTALRLVRPGGLVAYVTCSPHPHETVGVLDPLLRAREDVHALDARPGFPGVPDLGDGPHVQLWPHRHGTDAMFFALLTRSD